jgi:flagellin-like hook-associated protein FlgL
LASGIYRPQEQIEGKGVDERSDWYSLGAVLCYLLTGKPFEQPGMCRSVEQLKTARPDAPQELLVLCTSLLAENPADRPANADEVTATLDTAEKAFQAKPAAPKPKIPPIARGKAVGVASLKKGDSNAGVSRKTPVARAINDTPATISEDTIWSDSSSETLSFSINKSAGPPVKKPPLKKGLPQASAPKASDSSAVSLSSKSTPSSSKSTVQTSKKSKLPLILGGAIGGGVLLIALIVGAVVMFASGGGEEKVAQAPTTKSNAAKAKADKGSDTSSDEADAITTEVNPSEGPAETNPADVAAATTEVKKPVDPATTPADPQAVPAATTESPAKVEPAAPMVAADPATPTDKPAETAGTAPTELTALTGSDPPPAATAPAEAPMPPAAPPANPFAGFPRAVTLPKLPAGSTDVPADALTPIAFGPCKLNEQDLIIATLIGGESYKGGRQKFLLDPAQAGTAERDWEVRFGTDSSAEIIALISAKDDELTFQWTAEGVKNSGSPYLANCLIEFAVGPQSQQVALRQTVKGDPLVIDLDKANSVVKWNIEALPDEKQIEVEVAGFQSASPKFRIENPNLNAQSSITNVLVGPSDEIMPFAFELKMTPTSKQVDVKAVPKIKVEGLPPGRDRFNKKAVSSLISGAGVASQVAAEAQKQAAAIKDDGQKKKAVAQAEQMQADVTKLNAQVGALQQTVESVKSATVHFRVWYLGDTGKMLLLDTGGPPLPETK